MKICLLLLLLVSTNVSAQNSLNPRKNSADTEKDYNFYQQQIRKAEELIADQRYADAVQVYRLVFDSYDFLFLRDCKVATQVALHAGETDAAFDFLRSGFRNGWELKSARKEKWPKSFRNHPLWQQTVAEYPRLRAVYLTRISPEIREIVREMFRKDQRKALGALFTFTSAAQDRYAERKFAPHSKKQINKLIAMMKTCGYPGERLIGTENWASVIISHHNSISEKHTVADTLYPYIRPQLLAAISKGQMNPYEFAFMEDWYVAVRSGNKQKAFGILQNDLTQPETIKANELRKELGLRSLETQRKLSDVEKLTGMQFYIRRVH
ncbi:hypothetical protein [Dyadobacter aurulentus]|uniref:hypothetical protein n=1 Tax=Dyadobacter sp. UC 10 TaxID=2605428 RepID=UPI0011F1545C|nr:hypothetical protein [Dyadobacter sp. UC 10]KAA0992872.1 hypothetical protein FXO21_23210 [Dyadobacter sp. UC 10]